MPSTLQITLPESLQDVLASRLASEDQLPRWVLEAVVIEAYRERLLSRGKLGELLGLSFQEREDLLSARGVPYNYDPGALDDDARTLERALGRTAP